MTEIANRLSGDAGLLQQWTPRFNKYMLDTPLTKQWAALLYQGDELLFGGAKGGGKSIYLLAAAFQYADIRGYKALLMRRTHAQCIKADGIQTRLVNYLKRLKLEDCWSATTRQFTSPEGAVIEIGHSEEEKDVGNYDGVEYQFIGIDQVEQFTPHQYRTLQTCLRGPRCPTHHKTWTVGCHDCETIGMLMMVPLRMRATANPVGPYKNWYKKYFIKESPPIRAGVVQRVFIPAFARENPYVDVEQYERVFDRQDALTKKRLWEGDWDAESTGLLCQRDWFRVVEELPRMVARVRAWDRAGSEAADADYTVGVLMGYGEDGKCYVMDVKRERLTSSRVDDLQRQTAADDGLDCYQWGFQDPAAAGKSEDERVKRDVFRGYNYESETSTTIKTGKLNRWRPLFVAAERDEIRMLDRPWAAVILDELESLTEDMQHEHDDVADAMALSLRHLTQPSGEELESYFSENLTDEQMERLLTEQSYELS